jgi:hypothetical protein
MKKIYDQTLLRNEYAQALAKRLLTAGQISKEQHEQAQKLHADIPYNPNFFIKILLFFFGCLGFSFGGSFVSLFFLGAFPEGYGVLGALYGFGMIFALLFLIKQRKLHFSGVDNALIYGILGCALPLLFQLYETMGIDEVWVVALMALPFFGIVIYCFGEPLVAVMAYLLSLFIIASIAMKHPLTKALLPFILMILSVGVYYWLRRFEQQSRAFYWQTAIAWTQTVALIMIYVSGNYYVVRQANATLNGLPDPAPEIAFAPVFWGLTFLIPAFYLYFGFRERRLTLLILGLLGVLAAGSTVRMYHSVLPLEWVLVLGGTLVVLCAGWVIKLLKTPRFGFSHDPEEVSANRLGLEAVLLSQLTKNVQSADHDVQLGGGDFGGGGAGEKY